jgi:hypothetical protein
MDMESVMFEVSFVFGGYEGRCRGYRPNYKIEANQRDSMEVPRSGGGYKGGI